MHHKTTSFLQRETYTHDESLGGQSAPRLFRAGHASSSSLHVVAMKRRHRSNHDDVPGDQHSSSTNFTFQMLPPRQAPLWPNLLQNVYTTSPERTVSMTSVYAHTLECKSDPWQYSIYIRGASVVHIADNRVCLNIRWLMLGTGQCEKKTLFL